MKILHGLCLYGRHWRWLCLAWCSNCYRIMFELEYHYNLFVKYGGPSKKILGTNGSAESQCWWLSKEHLHHLCLQYTDPFERVICIKNLHRYIDYGSVSNVYGSNVHTPNASQHTLQSRRKSHIIRNLIF